MRKSPQSQDIEADPQVINSLIHAQIKTHRPNKTPRTFNQARRKTKQRLRTQPSKRTN
jgi:hypothetical protein